MRRNSASIHHQDRIRLRSGKPGVTIVRRRRNEPWPVAQSKPILRIEIDLIRFIKKI